MSDLFVMGCCGCFGFLRKPSKLQNPYMVPDSSSNLGDNLLQDSMCFVDGSFYNNGADSDFLPDTDENGVQRPTIRRSEDILRQWAESGLICREVPVKETNTATLSQVWIYMTSNN
jgi:calcium/calmodulin-dependent protein kinase kinase 1